MKYGHRTCPKPRLEPGQVLKRERVNEGVRYERICCTDARGRIREFRRYGEGRTELWTTWQSAESQ